MPNGIQVLKVKFAPDRPPNPFDNPLLACALHVVVAGVAYVSAYYALVGGTFVPAACGVAVVLAMEAAWLYFRMRRSR